MTTQKQASDADREYSCLMAVAPESLAQSLTEWADNNIHPDDVIQEAGKGIETDPHITVLYGLHTSEPQEVMDLCDCCAIQAKSGGLSLFENEDADVLKMDIESPMLHELNETIRGALDFTNSYDGYVPHMTVAYLKPGTGQKYLQEPTDLDDVSFTMQMLDFSDGERNHTYKKLPLQQLDKAAFLMGYTDKDAAVTLDLEVGDIVLTGRYKNKRHEVKELGTDELGQPTVNGMKLLAMRLEKKMPKNKQSRKTQELDKTASDVEDLRQAKAHSDTKNYAAKLAILRKLMQKSPGDFRIDSDGGKGIVGVTHEPTQFKLHAPKTGIPQPVLRAAAARGQQKAAADKRSDLPLRERVEVIATRGDKVLMQKRPGYVEMPGGGIDPGETMKATAKRETMEEAGAKLKNLKPAGVVEAKWFAGIRDTDWGKDLWEQYRGSRTHFYTAEVSGPLKAPTSDEGDGWKGPRFMSVDKAQKVMDKLPNSPGMKDYRDKQKALVNKEAFMAGYLHKQAGYKASRVSKQLLGTRQYPVDFMHGEYDEYLEALKSGNKEDVEEELQDIMYAAQMMAFQSTGKDRKLLGANQKIKEFLNRKGAFKKMFKSRGVPFNVDYLAGGSNYKKPHKIQAAFSLAGHDVSDDDAQQLSLKHQKVAKKMEPWVGVDLDGTLAKYTGWKGLDHIGAPIPKMVLRVKRWLRQGKTVKIFTARAYNITAPARKTIEDWCEKYLGRKLEVTNVKDPGMVRLWDDRAMDVKRNDGTQTRFVT